MEFMLIEKGTKFLMIDNYKFGFQKNHLAGVNLQSYASKIEKENVRN